MSDTLTPEQQRCVDEALALFRYGVRGHELDTTLTADILHVVLTHEDEAVDQAIKQEAQFWWLFQLLRIGKAEDPPYSLDSRDIADDTHD